MAKFMDNRAHWSTYPYVQITVKALPQGVTTFDIYNNFQRHGNVSKIIIYDSKGDGTRNRGDVYFQPPPKDPIWDRGRVSFTGRDGSTTFVYLALSHYQPKTFQVESPVQRGVMYPERIEILAQTLTWGFLTDPTTMTTTASTNEDGVRLVLNLKRREIEIFFPLIFRSNSRTAVRLFRFAIALDQHFTISRSQGGYILHLSNIPPYSKQLKEAIGQTHNSEAKSWSEEDTWARQTDLFDHKADFIKINGSAVSLCKEFNSINITRWTTFHLRLKETEDSKAIVFRNALRDFNIDIRDSGMKTISGGTQLDALAWDIINGATLPFSVRYLLEVCLSQGWLNEYQITSEFMQRLADMEESKAQQMLMHIDSYQERVWNPMSVFDDLRYRRPVKKRAIPENCIEVHSVTVTATSLIWHAPSIEITNRVIRKHRNRSDRFLRVRFEDDAYRGRTRLFPTSNNKMVLIYRRVKRALLHGIKLGDRTYQFLAWGNSQLRDHGTYFFANDENVTASSIRAEMGEFDQEKVVAKRAARMGQCFSTTKAVRLRLPSIISANTIPDIQHGKFTFTDGVGKISRLAALIIHQQLKIRGPVPSLFQFRLGGCKGVLTVWPELNGVDVQVRASQFKFDSTSDDLEIIRWSEFWQPFLNRQIIICLSNLGVSAEIFLRKQEETVQALDAAMKDDKAAIKALRDNIDPNLMTLSIVDLVDAGFRASDEPFVMSTLQLWRAWSLKYLKEKAKIPVPKGAFVLGCVDETNTLHGHHDKPDPRANTTSAEQENNLPQIFIQITDPHTNRRRVILGICVLARNPSLHRGDIRVVKAVDVPALQHLCDVVVMPANGDRDLPSMCSGGDLDGDDYMVIWDPDLIPSTWNAEPFHYDPPAPKKAVNEITTEDIIDFFYDYLQNDHLGRIAHAHLAAADFLDEGIESQTCLELVHLHSMAVDYPKTGIPAIMERHLERNVWPHFMEKKGKHYTSHKVLGKLYDAVKRTSFTPKYDAPFDSRILNAYNPTEEVLQAVQGLKHDYDNSLQRIMAQHNIRTEFEVWSTFVLDHSKASRDFKFHEEIGNLSSTLKEQFYDSFCELAGGRDFDHLAPVAVAAYQYTNASVQIAVREVEEGLRYDGIDGMPFVSFPWVLKDTLCQLAKGAKIREASKDEKKENGTTALTLDDPLDMTAEQLAALGLNEDMEL